MLHKLEICSINHTITNVTLLYNLNRKKYYELTVLFQTKFTIHYYFWPNLVTISETLYKLIGYMLCQALKKLVHNN